jgi:peptidoglycan/LPS O-acetylase OafA/YrhL
VSADRREQPLLDALRWLCALLVMQGHVLGWVFDTDAPGMGAFAYLLDLGHPLVVVFFVISGYLIGGGLLARWDSFSLREYAAARFARIYVVAAPALALTALLDGIVYLTAPSTPLYAAPWGHIYEPVFASYAPLNVWSSALSLESVIGLPMGSNKPLWSLGLEWFFYGLFPLLLMAAGRLVRPTKAHPALMRMTIAALAVVPMMLLGQIWMATFWIVWLAGAAASQFRAPKSVAAVAGAVGLAALLFAPWLDRRMGDTVEGLAFALCFSAPEMLAHRVNRSVDKRLAAMSYSLYLTHLPVLTFAVFWLWRAGLFPTQRLTNLGLGALYWAGLSVLVLAAAFGFAQLFERRTAMVRRALLGPGPRWITRPSRLARADR